MLQPLGKRVMLLLYIRNYMQKSDDITWEEYYKIANEEYMMYQMQIVEDNKKRQAELDTQCLCEEQEKKVREEEEKEKERLWIAAEEQEREHQAEILHLKQAEEECKKKEEEVQQQKIAAQKKLELQAKEREKALQQFKNILPGMNNSVKVKTEPGEGTAQPKDNPFGTLPCKPNSVEHKLVKIGELIIDEDVLFALENLKKMGTTMRNTNKEKDKETSEGISKSLFTSPQPK